MDDLTFARRAAVIAAAEPSALGVVLQTSDSVPRRPGAMMVRGASGAEVGTVGGGAMEARVLEAMAASAAEPMEPPRRISIDLGGSPADVRDGICGGTMLLEVRGLRPGTPSERAWTTAAGHLAAGTAVRLTADAEALVCASADDASPAARPGGAAPDAFSFGPTGWAASLHPRPLLLVVGGGHCGEALARVADGVGFDVVVQDDRGDLLSRLDVPPGVTRASSPIDAVVASVPAGRELHVALVTRSFRQDLDALEALGRRQPRPASIGVMGSRRRLGTVFGLLRDRGWTAGDLAELDAPIGLDLGAETPNEIAVSIVAGLIRRRRGAVSIG